MSQLDTSSVGVQTFAAMGDSNLKGRRLGWVGTGRMGYALATRLLEAGCDVAVYNRTRAKAEPLAELGAAVVDSPADLADREIVFPRVAGPEDFKAVVLGETGLRSRPDAAPTSTSSRSPSPTGTFSGWSSSDDPRASSSSSAMKSVSS